MSAHNGGPAFPVDDLYGMTLRDYFAAKALAAFVAAIVGRSGSFGGWLPHELAAVAYEQADAMLKAREPQA